MIQFLRSLFCLEFSRFRPGLILIFCAGLRVKTVILVIPFTLYIGQIITVSVSCNPHAIPVYIRLVNRIFTVGAFRVHRFPKTVKPNLVCLVPIALPLHFSLSIYSSIHKTIVKLRAPFILSKKIYGGFVIHHQYPVLICIFQKLCHMVRIVSVIIPGRCFLRFLFRLFLTLVHLLQQTACVVENGGNVVPIPLGVDKAADSYHQCQHEGVLNHVLSFLPPHFSHLFTVSLF